MSITAETNQPPVAEEPEEEEEEFVILEADLIAAGLDPELIKEEHEEVKNEEDQPNEVAAV